MSITSPNFFSLIGFPALFALELLPNRRSIEYDVVMSYESYLNSNFQMALLKLTFMFKINLETCTSLCMCCIFSFPDMYVFARTRNNFSVARTNTSCTNPPRRDFDVFRDKTVPAVQLHLRTTCHPHHDQMKVPLCFCNSI